MSEPLPSTLPALRSVAVIGAGYVGLPLCLHLAKAGLNVTAVDIDEQVVREVNERRAKIEEKEDFESFFEDPDVQANLRAQTTPVAADAFVIAVPTPVDHGTKEPDLRALVAATESILPFVQRGNLVIVESTIPPLTTENLVRPILERNGLRVGSDLLLAHCPERVLPGNIMAEAVFNARIVGGIDQRSGRRAAELLGSFVKGKLLMTDATTAEFVKLIENSYRDVNVAFANQVAVLCERLGIDAGEAIDLANHHPRVDILKPGIGVGGHCIPVDPWFLVAACPDLSGVLRAARQLNDTMPERTAAKICAAVEGVETPRVVCLGATYKPNVRDLRESPALEVYEILKSRGLDVSLYDPLIPEMVCDSVLAAARGADALAILVPHDLIVTEIRYRKQEILRAMRRPKLLAFTPGIL
ncbi:MAG TPA: nucleotide sugar dehydrogenase [Thermoanaerobaculia bacterium]|nr:nucleotide sugar dehydrogenase [Thermoanaerobaculia bacterium]